MTGDALPFYESAADTLRARYDALAPEAIFAPVLDLLPAPPAPVLDAGAGSGRDAAWLLARGHAVTAAEPAAAFRAALPDRLPGARVLDARLPDLAGIDGPFALALVNAVWQHLDAPARDAALARLKTLLAPGGRLLLSLRHGPAPADRPVHPLDPDAEAARAAAAGLAVLRRVPVPARDPHEAAAGVAWTWLACERTAP